MSQIIPETSAVNASLLRLKLLDGLRTGDNAKIDSILDTLYSSAPTSSDVVQLKATILHYAVQIAPLSSLVHLVHNTKYKLDINAQDPEGNTPLHLAVLSSRLDIVKYLLSLPSINDTITNLNGVQPVELCKDLDIAQLMQIERAKFVETSANQLRSYFTKRDFKSLEKLLNSPRSSDLLDINGSDPETGDTVLHEFIKKNDFDMVDWILKHGGDPFKRDRRGKLPSDLVVNKNDKNDKLKRLIKTATKEQHVMDSVINNTSKGAPTYKGYLRKWTNFASGYKLRYFVLDSNGILSYYSNQDDTNNACRGSLNLSFAKLHLDSSEKLKFEILGKNGVRWHLKANHPVETNRWVWTLQNAISLAKDSMKKMSTQQKLKADEHASLKNRTSFEKLPTQMITPSTAPGALSVPRTRHQRNVSNASNVSVNSLNDFFDENNMPPSRSSTLSKRHILGQINENRSLNNADNESIPPGSSIMEDYDSVDEDDDDYSSHEIFDERDRNGVNEQISILKRSLTVEITSLLELFKQDLSHDKSDETYEISKTTLTTIYDLFNKYNILIGLREESVLKKLERQKEVNHLWENSIKQLEDEIQKRETQLAEFDDQKKQLKKIIKDSLSDENLNEEKKKNSQIDEILKEQDESDDEFYDADAFEEADEENLVIFDDKELPVSSKAISVTEEPSLVDATQQEEKASETVGEEETLPALSEVPTIAVEDKELPVVEKTESQTKAIGSYPNEAQKVKQKSIIEEGSFLGYENGVRKKLDMDEDDRPKVGLWGILKSMIGKDMTRMTLPVSFNECTSLVQRLAEDLEYPELLDTASQIDDSTLRMVYVAAFAASEYASSINRIAKPFNPLLGETYEYCRPDKNYRLLVEQVSHHPPVSAAAAESANWDYYGENAVDSSFKGRSFDFKHLGKIFCHVRPNNGSLDMKTGKKVDQELYSWKKVNTSVVGIIVGNPTVDNFGTMEVRNHTTGDVAIVDMKQRGWRASSAYELRGTVTDANGKEHWLIGGHWNSKLLAKRVTSSTSAGDRRNSLVNSSAPSNISIANGGAKEAYSGAKFLVWQANVRPKSPFNLTSFAITLNDINDRLKPWLAPTDTRLRPDQRAMEDGRYDEAASEKHRVEEKQRAARKAREMNKETYKPNWFVKRKHPITGDAFWESTGEYWKLRKEQKLSKAGDIF